MLSSELPQSDPDITVEDFASPVFLIKGMSLAGELRSSLADLALVIFLQPRSDAARYQLPGSEA